MKFIYKATEVEEVSQGRNKPASLPILVKNIYKTISIGDNMKEYTSNCEQWLSWGSRVMNDVSLFFL